MLYNRVYHSLSRRDGVDRTLEVTNGKLISIVTSIQPPLVAPDCETERSRVGLRESLPFCIAAAFAAVAVAATTKQLPQLLVTIDIRI